MCTYTIASTSPCLHCSFHDFLYIHFEELLERVQRRRESRGGLRGRWGHWSISPTRKGWGSWACLRWRSEGWEGTLEMLINLFRVGVKRMGPDSFQWCPATGQGAMGTNWSRGSSSWRQGRTSSLWEGWSPGPGCPEGLWSLLLWRYSNPPGRGPVQPAVGDPALTGGLDYLIPRGPFQPLTFSDSMILWFCEISHRKIWNYYSSLLSHWTKKST